MKANEVWSTPDVWFVNSQKKRYFLDPFIDESKSFRSYEICRNGHCINSQPLDMFKVILLVCTADTVVAILWCT